MRTAIVCASLWLVTVGAAGCGQRTRATDTAAARSKSPSYEERLGREVYEYHCQTCHGETGAGDGFNAFNLDPRPRDLTAPALHAQKSDADFEDAIRRGGIGVGLSPLMPPYGRTLSPDQLHAVVVFVRRLRSQPGS